MTRVSDQSLNTKRFSFSEGSGDKNTHAARSESPFQIIPSTVEVRRRNFQTRFENVSIEPKVLALLCYLIGCFLLIVIFCWLPIATKPEYWQVFHKYTFNSLMALVVWQIFMSLNYFSTARTFFMLFATNAIVSMGAFVSCKAFTLKYFTLLDIIFVVSSQLVIPVLLIIYLTLLSVDFMNFKRRDLSQIIQALLPVLYSTKTVLFRYNLNFLASLFSIYLVFYGVCMIVEIFILPSDDNTISSISKFFRFTKFIVFILGFFFCRLVLVSKSKVPLFLRTSFQRVYRFTSKNYPSSISSKNSKRSLTVSSQIEILSIAFPFLLVELFVLSETEKIAFWRLSWIWARFFCWLAFGILSRCYGLSALRFGCAALFDNRPDIVAECI